MEFVVGLMSLVFQIAVVAWAIRLVVRMRKLRGTDPFGDPDWAKRPAFSAQDAASQILIAAGLFLAQGTVLIANQRAGEPIAQHLVVLASAALVFAAAYRYRSPILLAVAGAETMSWWIAALAHWTGRSNAGALPMGILLIAVVLWCAGRISETIARNERFANVYWVLGVITITLVLFVLSTQAGMTMLSEAVGIGTQRITSNATITLAALSLAAIGIAWHRGALHRLETVWLAAVVSAMTALTFLPLRYHDVLEGTFGGTATLSGDATAWAVVLNLLLLSGLLGLALLGYARREDGLITLSAILLFVFVVVKYFDWLFKLLDRGVAFIGAGAVLIAAGLLMERARRMAIGAMEGGVHE